MMVLQLWEAANISLLYWVRCIGSEDKTPTEKNAIGRNPNYKKWELILSSF
jgi:hypothetical protein